MKMKLVEIYETRDYHQMLMRFPVHDELDGDVPDKEHGKRVAKVLDGQLFPLRIPILWDTGTGPNWAEVA